MKVDGQALTSENAKAVAERGLEAIAAGDAAFDLSSIAHVDSSAVAVLLAWQRAARAGGLTLQLCGDPAALRSLAVLYGVDGLLPLSSSASA